jgi:transcriptional regulator with XRE-family HTH domain
MKKRGDSMHGKLFKFIRQSSGLTQEVFAQKLGISKSMVSLIEIERKAVSKRVYTSLVESYGTDYLDECRQFLKKLEI